MLIHVCAKCHFTVIALYLLPFQQLLLLIFWYILYILWNKTTYLGNILKITVCLNSTEWKYCWDWKSWRFIVLFCSVLWTAVLPHCLNSHLEVIDLFLQINRSCVNQREPLLCCDGDDGDVWMQAISSISPEDMSEDGLFYVFILCPGSTGAAGPRLFTIHQIDTSTEQLPKAHTW